MSKPIRFKDLQIDFIANLAETYELGNSGIVPLYATYTNGNPAWSVQLDACVSESSQYMGRVQAIWPCGELLLVQTYGEHWRGASSHRHKVHALNIQGKTQWTSPIQVSPTAIGLGEDLILLEYLFGKHSPEDLFRLLRLNASKGHLIAQSTLNPPNLPNKMKKFYGWGHLSPSPKEGHVQIKAKGTINNKEPFAWDSEVEIPNKKDTLNISEEDIWVDGFLSLPPESQKKVLSQIQTASAQNTLGQARIEQRMVSQGELYWAKIHSASSRSNASHPHLVIQTDLFNHSRIDTVIVCALSSNLNRANEPGNIRLKDGEGQLPAPSVIVVSQISSLAKDQLGEHIGTLSQKRVDQVLKGLQFQQKSFFTRP